MARKKSGSLIGKLITGVVIALIAYSFLSDSPQTTNTTYVSETNTSTKHSSGQKTYALKGSANTWPDIQSNKNNIVPYTDKKSLLSKNYYIVLDASGSMDGVECSNGETKMKASINALEQFLQSAPKEANFGLSVFHHGKFQELVKLSRQTGWKSVMQNLRQKLVPKGGTPLASATVAAQQKLEEQGRRQLGYGEYNLVLITDGQADHGQDPKAAVEHILQSSPVNLNVIGFCIDERNVLNQPGLIQYRTATDPESLKQSLQDVLAESPDFNISDFSN